MPSIDELIGSVDSLASLTDEQLLEKYKDIFILEPQVPLDQSPTTPKQPKPKQPTKDKEQKRREEMEARKKMLLEDAKMLDL